jgi:hypothetical protein
MSMTLGDITVVREGSVGKQRVNIELSRLAFEGLTSGGPEAAGPLRMEDALRCYVGDRGTDRPAWPYPGFLRSAERRGEVELELEVAEDLWRAFSEEAERQDVTVGQLAEHAAFYFAAEVDAGRVTERILEDLGPADAEADAAEG